MYVLNPFNLQEITMPSVIIYIVKLLFISCKYRSKNGSMTPSQFTFTFQRRRTERKRDIPKKKFSVFNSLVFKKTIKSTGTTEAFLISVKLTLQFIRLNIFIWKLFLDNFSPWFPMFEIIS